MLRVVIVCCLVALASCQGKCEPEVNCKLPMCRCWFDSDIPGKLSASEIPQIVLVTFEEAVNEVNADLYRSLFKASNPNGCSSRGTFFIKDEFTDYPIVRELYDEGHEIGAGSMTGVTPSGPDGWGTTLKTIKEKLVTAGIDPDDIRGVRAPLLSEGGLDQFIGMGNNGYAYDASCITIQYDEKTDLKWPYTYDFLDSPGCTSGGPPTAQFPGKWQFLIAALQYQGEKCATPTACTAATTQKDIFDLFLINFDSHYEGGRTPYILVIDAEFVQTPYKLAGLQEFLEYINAAFQDTWVLNMKKALQWIHNPTRTANITDFDPWKC